MNLPPPIRAPLTIRSGVRVSKTRLAGVDQLLDDATSFFRRAAASAVNRPLLLCGAKGSGKTSLANLIAEHLESDREVVAGKYTTGSMIPLMG